jgi:hypothetical protein
VDLLFQGNAQRQPGDVRKALRFPCATYSCLAIPAQAGIRKFEQEISDRPGGLSLKTNLEEVCIPSQVATVETPAVRKGSQASRLSFGRGFKPKLVLR